MKWTVQELQILKNGIDDNLSYDEIIVIVWQKILGQEIKILHD